MNTLDPEVLFSLIAKDVPRKLHRHLYMTGSLAAAYEYRSKLQRRGINTKDADLMVHPAGDVVSSQEIASKLLELGWRKTKDCYPQQAASPVETLRAIRLAPPDSDAYFLELLNIPATDQIVAKEWIPVELDDGWYGLPSFRFMGLTAHNRKESAAGLEYASPSTMALSNLLAHPEIGTSRIESGEMSGVLRSAKDLGRVLSLAHLAGREATEAWVAEWQDSLQYCFPYTWRELAQRAGAGLRALLDAPDALEEARGTVDIGLLHGLNVTEEQLIIIGERLLADAIELLEHAGQRG